MLAALFERTSGQGYGDVFAELHRLGVGVIAISLSVSRLLHRLSAASQH